MDFKGLLICFAPAALGIVLFWADNYLIDHPEIKDKIKNKFKQRRGRH